MKKQTKVMWNVGLIGGLLLLLFVLEQILPSGSMLFTVLKKGAIYALVAVSMNLLNGFTGLFSLGHAGFMLIGAYTYAIFSIPAASRDTVYQYYDAAIRISFPEVLGNALGGFGTVLGVIICSMAVRLIWKEGMSAGTTLNSSPASWAKGLYSGK